MNKKFSIGLGLVLAAAVSNHAFADACDNLGNNAEWRKKFAKLETAVDNGQFEDAIEHSKALFAICSRSPALMFYTGQAMKGKGDIDRAKQYFIKASDLTSEIAVDTGLSRRIWFARYEAEFPDASPEARQAQADQLAAEQAKYSELKAELDAHHIDLRENNARIEIASAFLNEKSKRDWGIALWSGVGITAAGIILIVSGGVLTTESEEIEKSGDTTTEKSGFAVTKPYVAGWTLLGAGIAATVGGTVLMGIAGYNYVRVDLDNDGAEDESVSFNVSPTGISFGMTF